MSHAECQDLLLDLAYGELDAARAAEVEQHLAGCAACSAERALIDGTRRAAAPLREEEQPSAGFDERILAAAHAEASLRADGTPGPVIEVTATERPVGIEAAHIDPLTAVVHSAPRRRGWALRLALGGSIAAAAVLALAVSSSLRRPEPLREPAPEQFAIHVRAPQAAPEPAAAPAAQPAAPSVVAAPPPAPAAVAAPAPPAAAAPAPAAGSATAAALPPPAAAKAAPPPPAAAKEAPPPEERAPRAAEPAQESAPAQPPPAAEAKRVARDEAEAAAGSAAPPAASQAPAAAQMLARRAASSPLAALGAPPQPAASDAGSQEAERAPAALEQQAAKARRDGNYALAASLFRQAAAARTAQDPSASAWDLAHAVECYAAVSQFDEARRIAADLAKLYPSEAGPVGASRRALRAAQTSPAEEAIPER